MKTPWSLYSLAGVLIVLGGFIAFTTSRWEALLHAAVAAGCCVFLASFLHKDLMRPPFESRGPEKP